MQLAAAEKEDRKQSGLQSLLLLIFIIIAFTAKRSILLV